LVIHNCKPTNKAQYTRSQWRTKNKADGDTSDCTLSKQHEKLIGRLINNIRHETHHVTYKVINIKTHRNV